MIFRDGKSHQVRIRLSNNFLDLLISFIPSGVVRLVEVNTKEGVAVLMTEELKESVMKRKTIGNVRSTGGTEDGCEYARGGPFVVGKDRGY